MLDFEGFCAKFGITYGWQQFYYYWLMWKVRYNRPDRMSEDEWLGIWKTYETASERESAAVW